MSAVARDAGLLRAVGPGALAASIICQTVGAGIFAVPAALAASLGPHALYALLGCGIAASAVAICFAEGGSRIPTSGGAYGYVQAAFGDRASYVVGTLLWLSNVLGAGGVAAALGDVLASRSPGGSAGLVRAATILLILGGIAAVNVRGVTRGASLIQFTVLAKLLPLVVFVAAGAGAVHADNFSAVVAPAPGDVGRALILGVFAYTGLEASLCASGEVDCPNRTIPRALAIALPIIIALYLAIQAVAQGILGPALAHSQAPLADAMARVNPALGVLMLAGAAVSMFGGLSSDLLASPRQLFAFARDGFLPRALGRVHPRSRAPHVAIGAYAGVAALLALTGSFAELAVLAALASAAVYVAGCAAAWRLARRGVALAGPPLAFPLLPLVAAFAIGAMLTVIALAARQELIGLGVLLLASALVYQGQERRRARAASRA